MKSRTMPLGTILSIPVTAAVLLFSAAPSFAEENSCKDSVIAGVGCVADKTQEVTAPVAPELPLPAVINNNAGDNSSVHQPEAPLAPVAPAQQPAPAQIPVETPPAIVQAPSAAALPDAPVATSTPTVTPSQTSSPTASAAPAWQGPVPDFSGMGWASGAFNVFDAAPYIFFVGIIGLVTMLIIARIKRIFPFENGTH